MSQTSRCTHVTTTSWFRKQHFQFKLIDTLPQWFQLGKVLTSRAFGTLCVCFGFCLFVCFYIVLLVTIAWEHSLYLVGSQMQRNIAPKCQSYPLRNNELQHGTFHPLEHSTTGLERIKESIWFFTLHLNKNKHNLTKSWSPEENILRELEFQKSL